MNRFSKLAVAISAAVVLSACKSDGGTNGAGDTVSTLANASPFAISSEQSSDGSSDALSNPLSQVTLSANAGIDTLLNVEPGVQIAVSTTQEGKTFELVQVQYDIYTGEKKRLFGDKATFKELMSYRVNSRHFVHFSHDGQQLTVTNWVPRDLHNMVLVARYQDKQYRVMELDVLRGIERFKIDLPWLMGARDFKSEDGEILDLSQVQSDQITFDFIAQDTVQKAIANIDLNWNFWFRDYVLGGSKGKVCRPGKKVVWRPTRPQDARYLLTFMIHAAQTVSHPKFYEFWMKTPFVSSDRSRMSTAHRLTRDEFDTYTDKEKAQYSMQALADGKYYNKAHRNMVFKRYFNKKFSLGMTGGGGLGGGATVGVNHNKINELAWKYSKSAVDAAARGDWFLPSNDRYWSYTAWNIFGHEAGHALGFSHKQTYTKRNKYSHIAVGSIVYQWLVGTQQTIVTKDTMVGRDVNWEKPYKKKAKAKFRSRPRCGDGFEWGGAYPKHDYQIPQRGTKEWGEYIEAHLDGRGFEYLKELNIRPSQYYRWYDPAKH